MRSESVSHSTLCDCLDCSLPGSSVHGILQARIPEWVAISSSGDLPDPGIEPGSSSLQADSLPSEPPEKEGGNKFSSDFLSVRRFTHINTLTLMTLPGAGLSSFDIPGQGLGNGSSSLPRDKTRGDARTNSKL